MESVFNFVYYQYLISSPIDSGEYIQNTYYPIPKMVDRKKVIHSNIDHHNTIQSYPYVLYLWLYVLKTAH